MGVLEDVLASVRSLHDTVAIQADLIVNLRERVEVLEEAKDGYVVGEVVEFDPPPIASPDAVNSGAAGAPSPVTYEQANSSPLYDKTKETQ